MNAVEAIVGELSADPEVSFVLFFGSAQRGRAAPRSDLDFYVGTTGVEHRRGSREIGGRVAELFFNPVARLRQMFRDEDQVALHAFATGEVAFDRTGEGRGLVGLARGIWAAGPRPLTAEAAARWRYRITALASDAEALDPGSAEARLVAGLLVPLALEGDCAFHGRWSDQPKDLIRRVAEADPDLARAAAEVCAQGMSPQGAVELADRVLAPVGGRLFAYSTEPAT